MASVGNILLDKEILLESGTNELEILVFRLSDYNFGINVAKVREVLPAVDITSLPKAHDSVLGVFKLRDAVVPCVSLRTHLGVEAAGEDDDQTLILADFNHQQTAFVVDEVERIHRLSWEHILAVPNLAALDETPVTAVARIGERLVIMLDFEMISDQVTEQFFRTGAVENPLGLPREELRILLADDSPTVRQAIGETLRTSGYTNLQIFENGGLAWEWIEEKIRTEGDVSRIADLMISDVEMPQIDGLHLTKRIKEHPQLNGLPVLLYSSIVTPDNRKKGEAVGADAQVSKPELAKVVELADELISRTQNGRSQGKPIESTPTPASVQQELPEADAQTKVDPPVESQPAKADQPAVAETSPEPAPVEAPKQPAAAPTIASGTSPDAVNPRLWQTFRAELTDRVRTLRRQCDEIAEGKRDEEVLNETFRTLHTVKSAAMVVPVEEVSHLTHVIEGLLESSRTNPDLCPLETLESFVEWLDELTQAGSDLPAALSKGQQLHDRLAAQAPTA